MFSLRIKIFLSIFLYVSLTQTMQEEKDIDKNLNTALWREIVIILKNNEFDLSTIEQYLQQGANPGYIFQGQTLLNLTIRYQRKDIFDLLLKYGDINTCDTWNQNVLHHLISIFTKNPKPISIEYLLQKKADINVTNRLGQTPLLLSVRNGSDLDIIKPLMQYDSHINRYPEILVWPIKNNKLETIELLCKKKALLYNLDLVRNSVFHLLVSDNKPKKYFETIITHAQFGPHTITTADEIALEFLLILKKQFQSRIPKELQFRILSMLPIEYFKNYNSILCKQLLKAGYYKIYLAPVNYHLQCIQEVLQHANIERLTPDDMLNRQSISNPNYVQEISPLLNGKQLEEDKKIFDKNFPAILHLPEAENNLICKILKNYADN